MEVLGESKMEIRNNKFLNTFDAEKLRRKREEGLIELRKQKRNQQVSRKRALQQEGGKKVEEPLVKCYEFFEFDLGLVSKELAEQCPELVKIELQNAERLQMLIEHIDALEELSALFHPIQTLRKILSCDGTPPLQFIMNSGISNKLISLLSCQYLPLQTESMWCVLNLATGQSHIVKMLMDQDVIEQLKAVLTSNDPELLELCVWCIGNLAGDSVDTRDKLTELVPQLTELIKKVSIDKWKNIIWALSNLCRGKPLPEREITQQILSIVPIILRVNDEDSLADCCWALSYISDGDNQRIQDIIDLGVLETLIQILGHDSEKVTIPCLRALGNIVTGNEDQTQKVLNLGFVDRVATFLISKKVSVKREALWTLSNITAGSDEQINLVLSHPCVNSVVECLKDSDFEIKKEALWTISNATHAKSPNLVLKVIELGAFPLLCDILDMKDSKILLVVLEAINNLLRAGNAAFSSDQEVKNNEVALKFDEIGGLSKMEELQEHPNTKIYKKVIEIMDEHYGLIEVTDENEPPQPQLFSFN
ncbi:hypothetical protein SteCoe_9736 [Stentor coeruleus]|uniref:Importin subunit alpha n=1 Tax=Stentor coeruleus TaxID=5963 RepID=A0A1R2CH89_9CILI|nr:hypothetical protein SteCoe_9736 [Stentor coeruleus]